MEKTSTPKLSSSKEFAGLNPCKKPDQSTSCRHVNESINRYCPFFTWISKNQGNKSHSVSPFWTRTCIAIEKEGKFTPCCAYRQHSAENVVLGKVGSLTTCSICKICGTAGKGCKCCHNTD
ncbi:unnamed protein product, partial [Cuscuta epithymum]